MSSSFAGWDDEVLGLAAELTTEGLEGKQQEQLESEVHPEDLAEFERAVAAIHLAGLERLEAPPTEVLGRLHESARQRFSSPRESRSWWGIGGWLAAAALLVLLLWPASAGPAEMQLRDELVAAGAQPLAWTVASEDVLAGEVRGDVVWSDERQAGVMRFQGLPVNRADELQYQLWIFDPTRPDWEDHPVDGGVFDVSSDGEVLVPIDPKIEVGQAALFAITAERPGGVVVSNRERLLVTAAVPQ